MAFNFQLYYMSLDEFLFGRIAVYIKERNKKRNEDTSHHVTLDDLKPRLTLLANAVTGKSINIYNAHREGGYKNDNFFLPSSIGIFNTIEENISFYLFRVLFLSIQKNLQFNWKDDSKHELLTSQQKANESASEILKVLFSEFPSTQEIHSKLKTYYQNLKTKNQEIDYSFIYGKWMFDNPEEASNNKLQNISKKIKTAIESEITTILKANAVEEMQSLEVDKKQQEDAVLNNYFEKIETAEEFGGGTWRDFDGSDEMDEHANALEELNLTNTVRVDDTAHSVYQADFTENVNISESAEINRNDYHILYDEWNYSKKKYRKDYCKVYPKKIKKLSVAYYKKTIQKNASTLTGLRKMLTSVNNKSKQFRRQTQGDDFDTDALTDFFIDLKTGHTPSEKIYISKRKKEKDLSILMLLDTSLSSDSYANNNRVIDVEKEVSILFGEILHEFNVDFSINSFNSKTRNFTNYHTIKAFDEDWNKAKLKVGSIEPAGYTRIGTAIRHSGALLVQRESKNKWLILISDGKPNDYDKYEGKYGINDVKQALRELNEQHVNSYALAIEATAKYYLPQMFGANHFEILTSPVQLLESLAKLYEKIKFKS